MSPDKGPDCLKCEHFFVTWDPAFPRGCRVFGIKSRQIPSVEVRNATGRQCPSFRKSSKLKKIDEDHQTDLTV